MTAPIERTGIFQLAGSAQGSALVFLQALSFWGGIDSETGDIIDHSHPGFGENVAGKILVMPSGRGSSSQTRRSTANADSARNGGCPAQAAYSVLPRLKRSERGSAVSPRACSGAM